jgi:putative salt-induced outer membrane protein
VQNDLGLKVKINAKFALKATFQWRHNSDVTPGTDNDDTLLTMNVVYSF